MSTTAAEVADSGAAPNEVATSPTPHPRPLTPIQESDAAINTVAVTSESKQVINFHVDSDTIIMVDGHDQVEYRVCLSIVAAASPVWRVLFLGKDAQKRPAGSDEWKLKIDIDKGDVEALGILFNIVHFRFDKVPTDLSLDTLYSIARLVSKYDTAHLVYPWVEKWVKPYRLVIGQDKCAELNDKIAWIAWVFGDARLLKDMADSLIITTKLDGEGRVVNKAGVPLKDLTLPTDLPDAIITIRIKTIAAILAMVETVVGHLTAFACPEGIRYCKVGGLEVSQCQSMMFSSVMRGLMSTGLSPIPAAGQYKGSIVDLQLFLSNMAFEEYKGIGWAPHKSHAKCNLTFRESTAKILNNMSLPLEHHHLEHLASQARVSGINNDQGLDVTMSNLSPTAPTFSPSELSTRSGSIKSEIKEEENVAVKEEIPNA